MNWIELPELQVLEALFFSDDEIISWTSGRDYFGSSFSLKEVALDVQVIVLLLLSRSTKN